jgi:hypothetical protein
LTTWHMNHYLRCGHTNSWADKKETGFGVWNNLKLHKYIWELSNLPKNLTNQSISSFKCRVNCCYHSKQTTRHRKLQFILLCRYVCTWCQHSHPWS